MSTIPDRAGLLRETLIFDWKQWNPGVAWRSAPAMALALGVGIALGSPRAGLVAAAGAFTTGLGSLQTIRGSCLLPMVLAAGGMSVSTFIGMTLGHQSLWFVLMAGVWSAAYALLTAMRGGTSWVALQWTVWYLVAGAFHTTPRGAMTRCGLILAGGLVQTLVTWAVLRVQEWRRRDAGRQKDAKAAGPGPSEGPGLIESLGNMGKCMRLQTPVCLFSLRMALVVTAAAEFYRHTNSLSGYWVPMTALLVVRASPIQTLTRGVMRVAGTVVGAGVAGLIAAHLRPSPVVLAALIVFFAWWAFSVLNVNYALFTLSLTAYIVFLLGLAGIPAAEVVDRRALYTLLGGAVGLLAYADVFRKTRFWIRQDREEQEGRLAA